MWAEHDHGVRSILNSIIVPDWPPNETIINFSLCEPQIFFQFSQFVWKNLVVKFMYVRWFSRDYEITETADRWFVHRIIYHMRVSRVCCTCVMDLVNWRFLLQNWCVCLPILCDWLHPQPLQWSIRDYKFLGKIAVLFGKIVKIISLAIQFGCSCMCHIPYCSTAECVIKPKSANNFVAVIPIAHRYLWALHVKYANIVAEGHAALTRYKNRWSALITGCRESNSFSRSFY